MEKGRVLESWKAIAAYLGRTEKTARKWERELGLPVHRLEKTPKAHVFAYADELERWKAEKLGVAVGLKAEGKLRLFKGVRFWLLAGSAVILLTVVGILVSQIALGKKSVGPHAIKRVAILAFADLSPGKEYEYLCDGIADTLINALGNLEGLQVPARTSSFYFKGKNTPLQEIGKKLSVDYVLEASLQVEGDKLRVIPRLSNVADGYQLWSEKYDRSGDDIFAVQDDIARAVVETLRIKLLGQEEQKIVKSCTADKEAYNLYLKGRFLWEKRTKKEMLNAIDLFQKAIDRDPAYALAHVGIADCYHALATNRIAYIPGVSYPQAKAAALKAIKIDPNLAEAHASLATILFYFERNFPEAEKEFKEAIRINPAYGNAHHWYGLFLGLMGRHKEARREIFEALELEPLSPRVNANLGFVLILARRYEQALEELNKASELFPEDWGIRVYKLWAYAFLDQPEKGIQIVVDYYKKHGIDYSVPNIPLTFLLARAGHREEARKRLQFFVETSKKESRFPTVLAELFLALGDKEEALKWLEKAWTVGDPTIVNLKESPFYDPLRSDPRFTALLRRIGLEK